MQININAVHFKADKELEKFITSKLQKVSKFYENVLGGDVILKLENTDKPENKIAEIRLKLRGNELISIKQCKTFEEAIDLAIEALRKQLAKIKDKKKTPKTIPVINSEDSEDEGMEGIEDLEDIIEDSEE